jgi:hypothetical protein
MAYNDKARSPYQRYNKKPHKYSQLLDAWRAAAKAGRTDQMDALGREHTEKMLAIKPVDFNEAEAA